jgi:Arc/MetJ-type ribon-helix-helix transcriptional regulator
MQQVKESVTISLEPEALEAARADVRAGRSPSISAAVEAALEAQAKRQALKEVLDLLDTKYGPIDKEAEEWASRELDRASREILSSMREH